MGWAHLAWVRLSGSLAQPHLLVQVAKGRLYHSPTPGYQPPHPPCREWQLWYGTPRWGTKVGLAQCALASQGTPDFKHSLMGPTDDRGVQVLKVLGL